MSRYKFIEWKEISARMEQPSVQGAPHEASKRASLRSAEGGYQPEYPPPPRGREGIDTQHPVRGTGIPRLRRRYPTKDLNALLISPPASSLRPLRSPTPAGAKELTHSTLSGGQVSPDCVAASLRAPTGPYWMRHFFTEDVSPDNHPVVELQRRACWVGLALIAMSLSQIMNAPTIFKDLPAIFILVRCLAFCVLLLSFVAAWMAFRPGTLQEETKHLDRHPRRWQRIVLVSTLLLSFVGGFLCVLTIVDCFLPPIFSNDGTSLDTNGAELLLQGRNPYTDSSILKAARQFQIQADWTTPLRQGQFAGRLDYPSYTELQTVLDKDLKTGNAPEFESKVSYPALSFLTLVPFTWFKDYNVLPLYFLSYLLLIAIAWKVARPELRPWVLLLAMTNVPMWSSTYGGNLDIFYVLLIVIAWLLRAHRWRSALFLGLAIATKQIAWFFIPFYLIMTWRSHERIDTRSASYAEGSYGLTESIRRLAIAGCVGLVFNLPFILWNPQAWLAGVLAPVADPMFPLGLGLIELSVNHVLPFFPSWVYDMLEGIAMLVALAWYWCLCRKRPEAAMLLAILPLVFAWRSLPSYFFCSIYPVFILMAAKARPAWIPVPQTGLLAPPTGSLAGAGSLATARVATTIHGMGGPNVVS